MSTTATTTTPPGSRGLGEPGPALRVAALVTGVAFVVESLTSVVMDSHVGYHSLNVVLNVALLVACVVLARTGLGRLGATGAWGTAVMALLAGAGGAWAVAVEALTTSDAPGVVDGIAHTAVLASLLFLVPLGLGLRRVDGLAGVVVAVSSACLVVMVLVGLDQPEAFLAPEAVLGAGWLVLARRLAREATR